jgi:hypothetical protein
MMADPVAVSHDPAVAERFRYDHLLLTGPERVWVTAVIRSRLALGERSAGRASCQDSRAVAVRRVV